MQRRLGAYLQQHGFTLDRADLRFCHALYADNDEARRWCDPDDPDQWHHIRAMGTEFEMDPDEAEMYAGVLRAALRGATFSLRALNSRKCSFVAYTHFWFIRDHRLLSSLLFGSRSTSACIPLHTVWCTRACYAGELGPGPTDLDARRRVAAGRIMGSMPQTWASMAMLRGLLEPVGGARPRTAFKRASED